jgi:asparagine synthase (glutamine-hydrolysing)
LQKIEIEKLQLPALLRFEDKNSMYHSIESRLPFLDHHLLDYSVSLNSNHKIHKGWSKYILRKSMENILPKEIVWRKNKFAFNAPDKKWMQFIDTEVYDTIHSSNILNSIIDFKKLKNQFEHIKPREKWKLYNIAKWEKLFDVN